jgi:NADH:ubiquinone oxidoreductase subunit 3 (subunit A)
MGGALGLQRCGVSAVREAKGKSLEFLQPWHILIFLFVSVFWGLVLVIPFWHIFKKAGMSPFLSLLMLVPLANLVTLYVLAFSRWNPATPSQNLHG